MCLISCSYNTILKSEGGKYLLAHFVMLKEEIEPNIHNWLLTNNQLYILWDWLSLPLGTIDYYKVLAFCKRTLYSQSFNLILLCCMWVRKFGFKLHSLFASKILHVLKLESYYKGQHNYFALSYPQHCILFPDHYQE